MMKKKKTLLLILICLATSISLKAQNVIYGYDPAGNRELRTIELKQLKPDSADFKQTTVHDEFNDVKVIISPNPNGGKFTIQLEDYDLSTNVQIYLHSISGTLVYEKRKAKSITEVDISTKENGTYILSMFIGGDKKSWKVIKQ